MYYNKSVLIVTQSIGCTRLKYKVPGRNIQTCHASHKRGLKIFVAPHTYPASFNLQTAHMNL